MAKSKSFFGLRTGSTKSLTFQVYRGQQITKDRVYRVSNPRTDAQMTQRALIPIVAAARSTLKGLIDHSFEGVPYGEASLKEFSKQNLRASALTVSSYSPNGVSNAGFADLIVSNGTLSEDFEIMELSEAERKDKTAYLTKQMCPPFSFPEAKANDPASAIFNYLKTYAETNNVSGLKPGTQLSFLSIFESGTVTTKSASGSKDAALSDFVINRIMIPSSETDSAQLQAVNGDWRVKDDVAKDAKSVTIINSNGDEIEITGAMMSDDQITIVVTPKAVTEHCCGGALILSRYENGVWRRSSARLHIVPNIGHVYTFNDWLSVYQTTRAASEKYLNNGDDKEGRPHVGWN